MRATTWIAVGMAAVAFGCGGDDNEGGDRPADPVEAPATEPASGGHIHGLGVNPRDRALFIATHEGMFRVGQGRSRAERVGETRQDTMGFTVVGPDHFMGSGHPDLQTKLPPYLGLIESRDAGRTWKPLSLLGKADFHALEASGGMVYGSGSDFESREYRFLVSRDRGRTWQRRQPPEPITSIALNPKDARRLVTSGSERLYSSDDAGRTWRTLQGPPGLLAFAPTGRLYLIDLEGGVHLRTGEAWSPVGDIGGTPAAVEPGDDGELLVALHDGTVKVSVDDGLSWELRARL